MMDNNFEKFDLNIKNYPEFKWIWVPGVFDDAGVGDIRAVYQWHFDLNQPFIPVDMFITTGGSPDALPQVYPGFGTVNPDFIYRAAENVYLLDLEAFKAKALFWEWGAQVFGKISLDEHFVPPRRFTVSSLSTLEDQLNASDVSIYGAFVVKADF